jgi:hypothetical protein
MLLEHIINLFPNLTNRDIDLKLRKLLNCIGPSPKDTRDFRASLPKPKRQEIDWTSWCGLVENQGTTSSCVAQGNESMVQVPVNILRNTNNKDGTKMVNLDAMSHFQDICNTYYSGNVNLGAYPRDGLLMLRNKGILELHPDKDKVHKIKQFWRCETFEEAADSILTTGPIVASLKVYRSFFDCSGVVEKPGTKRDFLVGYHQISLVGRLKRGNEYGWKIRNSWGMNWGDCGYAFISDEILDYIIVEMWGSQYDLSLVQLADIAERYINTE